MIVLAAGEAEGSQCLARPFVAPAEATGIEERKGHVLRGARARQQVEALEHEADPPAADVRERGHLTTGFLGTPKLLAVLTRFGYLDLAYALLNREQFPSWLYPVKRGATTIWERWDGIKPDGTFQDPKMNSFNHYAYGAVGSWMYQTLGGIRTDPSAPGYRHFLVEVRPGGGFSHASTEHVSPYGAIRTHWVLRGDRMTLNLTIPANSGATLRIPRTTPSEVTEGGRPLSGGNGIARIDQDAEGTLVELAAGRFRFAYPYSRADSSLGCPIMIKVDCIY